MEYIYTDDTEMAHVLANSLIDDKGFDPRKVVKRSALVFFLYIVQNCVQHLVRNCVQQEIFSLKKLRIGKIGLD